jgi:hypothetical protein
MKTYRVIRSPLLAMSLAALALAPRAAWSSACNDEIVVEIHFAAGDVCWNYRGNATTFVGKFSRGQNVEARMSGESVSYDPQSKKDVTSWEARTPSVTGPNQFSAEAEMDSVLNFRTPTSGTYRIGFSPCAMWGGQGEVRICAK